MTNDADRLLCLADLFNQGVAARFEFGDRDFPHSISLSMLYDIIVFCNNNGMANAKRKPQTKRHSRVFTISFPEDLARQVDQYAKDESRNISELFREAFRAYRMERSRRRFEEDWEYARQQNTHGYTPDDVERLVHEVRAERRRERNTSE